MGGRTIGGLIVPAGLATVACLTFTILGDMRLWALSFAILCFLFAVHLLFIRRVIKRQIQKERELLVRALPEIEQAVRADAPRIELDAATREELRQLRDEITQAQREG